MRRTLTALVSSLALGAHRLRDHTFRVRLSGLRSADATAPARIVVGDRHPVRRRARYRRVATVGRQFARIREAIDRGVAGLEVAYGRRGRPLRFVVAEALLLQDEEVAYPFTRFRPRR